MKRKIILSILSCLILICAVIGFTACNNQTENDNTLIDENTGLEFSLNKEEQSYAVKDAKNFAGGELTIPSSFNGLPVTSIGYSAFRGCMSLTSITLPNSVTYIGNSAFAGCKSLTSITLPNSVTSIGGSAFYNCIALAKVNITDLSAWCKIEFKMNATTYDEIPNPLYYSNKLYLNGNLVTKLVIPSDVTSIGNYAFYGCNSLTSVTLPDSVTSIGNDAFSGCYNISSVRIGNSVTSIGENAFYGCRKLVEVYNLSSINLTKGDYKNGYIGYYVLDIITSQDTPSKLSTTKDGYDFYENGEDVYLLNYNGIETDLVLPDKYNNKNYTIYQYAFYNSTKIKNVTIPNSVVSIRKNAFGGCYSLTSVKFTDNRNWFVSNDTDQIFVTLISTSTNAKYLAKTYCSYTWIKQQN